VPGGRDFDVGVVELMAALIYDGKPATGAVKSTSFATVTQPLTSKAAGSPDLVPAAGGGGTTVTVTAG
jgi:hypothetical protein